VFCFVDVRSLERDTVIVGVQEFMSDGIELRPHRPLVIPRTGTERAVAYLQTLLDRQRAAASRRVLVVLGPSWLPKQLLSRDRSFRRLGIFNLIRQVHRDSERDRQQVLVIGPVRIPLSLASALDRAVERERGRRPSTM
jgi:hypothetical protein